MNDTGTCGECGATGPVGEFVRNYRYPTEMAWPVHYEGLWCKPCSDGIQVEPEKPKKERTILVLNPGG